ncbi:hypothetical protein AZE42_13269 [Rhizopogon vesiculosus]|uniref:Uncharacterized protein n=1 Tax=Rhizopogon vesiculosus TaxID=180088 RepID=A0A1J8R1H2_9AGAM|nr:hypothetical protein AZE42_13269 [Rhizopogon vesiculosus]
MSANLVMNQDATHSIEDDLEVAIFMDHTIDPKMLEHLGGFNKSNFLKGRSFLEQVRFKDRPALDTLLMDLTKLFSMRYVSLTTPCVPHVCWFCLMHSV